MEPVTRITFVDGEGIKFFGEGPLRLLRTLERTGSLRSAAMEMGMAYSKATKILKQAEAGLGFALTTRSAGGRDGGGSALTPEGKRWLDTYESYRDACVAENRRLYREYFPRTGCVIMASGMGVRFGGNKLMADFQGEPMILRAIRATEGLFDCRVVVTRHEDVAKLCREMGIETVLHDLPGRNDTVRLGLETLGEVSCCLFCPGDQPLLRRDTVARLLDNWKYNREKILRPAFEENQGAPVLFPHWAIPELLALPAGTGGGAVIRKYPGEVMTVPVADPFELADADTPEILETLRGLCHD